MNIRVAHLYPAYLNIYADRGNIAVLERRAALRQHSLEVTAVEPGLVIDFDAVDLVYVGGGQDREQAMIAPDLATRSPPPSRTGPLSSPCVAGTSFLAAGTVDVTGRSLPEPASSRM